MSFHYHGLGYGIFAHVPDLFSLSDCDPNNHISSIKSVLQSPDTKTRWESGYEDPHDITHGFDSLAHRHYQTPGFDLAAHTVMAGDTITVPDPRTQRMTIATVLGLHIDDMVQLWEANDRGSGQDVYPRGPWVFTNTLSPVLLRGQMLHLDKTMSDGPVVAQDAMGSGLRVGDHVIVTHPEAPHMDFATIAGFDDRVVGNLLVYINEPRVYPSSAIFKTRVAPTLPPIHPTVNLRMEHGWGAIDKGMRHGRATPDIKTPHGAYLTHPELEAHRAKTNLPHAFSNPAGPQHQHDRRAQYAVALATIKLIKPM